MGRFPSKIEKIHPILRAQIIPSFSIKCTEPWWGCERSEKEEMRRTLVGLFAMEKEKNAPNPGGVVNGWGKKKCTEPWWG